MSGKLNVPELIAAPTVASPIVNSEVADCKLTVPNNVPVPMANVNEAGILMTPLPTELIFNCKVLLPDQWQIHPL